MLDNTCMFCNYICAKTSHVVDNQSLTSINISSDYTTTRADNISSQLQSLIEEIHHIRSHIADEWNKLIYELYDINAESVKQWKDVVWIMQRRIEKLAMRKVKKSSNGSTFDITDPSWEESISSLPSKGANNAHLCLPSWWSNS